MSDTKKTDHYYLIDGSGYIFRAYYALPPLSRKSDGLPTGAVSGFCSMLYKLLEDSRANDNNHKPTHFAVIFDSARKNFRNEIYKDYKANRTDAPEDLVPQFEYIRKSVKAFNLPSVELINYEADDLIATYAELILDKGAKVTIVSSDKDLMQLFKKNVRIYDPMKNKFITLDDIYNKLDQYIPYEYTVDNIQSALTFLQKPQNLKIKNRLVDVSIEGIKPEFQNFRNILYDFQKSL